jgi:hypothetical protein
MSNQEENKHSGETIDKPRTFPATVVAVHDAYTVAINRGRKDGITKGMDFIVYGLSEDEIVDPETQEKLGHLEIVRGTGTVLHVQDRLATIESNQRSSKTQRVTKRTPRSRYGGVLASIYEQPIVEEIIEEGGGALLAFDEPEIGDKARPI